MSDAKVEQATAVLEAGRPADALRLIGAHLAQNPDDASAICVASDALRLLGRGQEAVDAAVNAVRLDPESASSWSALAFAQREVRDLPHAVASATHAMQLARSDWATHVNLALIAGEHDPTGLLSFQAAEEAVRLAPNSSETHQAMGTVYLQHNQPKMAHQAFATALRLNPQNEVAHHNLAIASLRSRNPARAVADLAQLMGQAPDDAVTHRNLRIAVGVTLGPIHSAVLAATILAYQGLRILLRANTQVSGHLSDGFESGARVGLAAVALLTVAIVIVLVLRIRKKLGSTLLPVYLSIVVRDRLIVAWAVVDALALLSLIVGPFLPEWAWLPVLGAGLLLAVTGLAFFLIRALVMRGDAKKR